LSDFFFDNITVERLTLPLKIFWIYCVK